MIKIIIADDHQMFIDGIYSIFLNSEEIQIMAHALNGNELMAMLQREQPDVILMDVNMPGSNGLNATISIHEKYPQIKILVLSMYNTREIILSMYRVGAVGYILKNASKDELIKAIKEVHAGANYFSVDVSNEVLRDEQFHQNQILSEREIEIIRLVSTGINNEQIAEKLFLSKHTVKTHRKNILAKLNMTSTAELIKYSSDMGLLPL